jgi:circadian clock protein KaiB
MKKTALEKDLKRMPKPPPEFELRLYITGATPNSIKAIANIRSICESYLKDRYALQIIDVYQDAALAQQEQIIALPLLIKKLPLPERKLIGDLSETEKVLKALGVDM